MSILLISLLQALSIQAASFFQALRSIRSSPKLPWMNYPFISFSSLRSLEFSSSFTLLVTPPTFRLFAKYFSYWETLLLNTASKWLFPETIPTEDLVQLAKTQPSSVPAFPSAPENCHLPNMFTLR